MENRVSSLIRRSIFFLVYIMIFQAFEVNGQDAMKRQDILKEIKSNQNKYSVGIDKAVSKNDIESVLKNFKNRQPKEISSGDNLIFNALKDRNLTSDKLKTLDLKKGIDIFKGDYRVLFSNVEKDFKLNQGQAVVVEGLKNKQREKLSFVAIAPISFVANALDRGFGEADQFVSPGSFVLPLSDDSLIIVQKKSSRVEGKQTIWNGTVSGQVGEVFLVSTGDQISGYVKSNSVHLEMANMLFPNRN
jgi:hypothetical protein